MSNFNKFLIFISFCVLTVFIFSYILIVSIPENPIKARYSFFSKKVVKRLTPQGWAFFTKNPRSEEIYFYEIDTTNNKIKNIFFRNVQSSQLFGIKRDNRLIISKLNNIINDIDTELWFSYRGNTLDFLRKNSAYRRINKITVKIREPAICGLYCLEMKEPIPWSWIDLERINMPSRLILIDFKCY